MITEVDIHLPLKKADAADARRKAVAQALQLSPKRVMGMRLLKESIDARRRPICKQLRLLVGVDEPLPPAEQPVRHYAPLADTAKRVVIVGSGPGGLFAALRCLELGLRPIVLERGKDVTARRFDLQPLHLGEFGGMNTESNYCFGEGGAGTFSDGKLFTRATKRGPVMEVYETFVAHGASPQILTDAHPHIGSDRLPDIIKAMRHSILNTGGEVHFETRMCGLL
ncbi:MAG: FAD-binding protein, partial [Akkermansia sp.]|nr:FAD-binding protein [Akkermansia sp.]